ncbi:hypothetical protein V1515DRAFT_624485 [Lipomyces mesembrius]
MNPRSTELIVPVKGGTSAGLAASATVPPHWKDFWFRRVPALGPLLVVLANASQYTTTLEDNAEFIANDLAVNSDDWVCKKVGVWDAAQENEALKVAKSFQQFEYFGHALEMMIHDVLDEEADHPPSPDQAILPRVI